MLQPFRPASRSQSKVAVFRRESNIERNVVNTLVAASDTKDMQLLQLGKVANALGQVGDIARIEMIEPPLAINGQPGTWTRTTGALWLVEIEATIFEHLGGLPVPQIKQFANESRRMNTPPASIASGATSMLQMIATIAENFSSEEG